MSVGGVGGPSGQWQSIPPQDQEDWHAVETAGLKWSIAYLKDRKADATALITAIEEYEKNPAVAGNKALMDKLNGFIHDLKQKDGPTVGQFADLDNFLAQHAGSPPA